MAIEAKEEEEEEETMLLYHKSIFPNLSNFLISDIGGFGCHEPTTSGEKVFEHIQNCNFGDEIFSILFQIQFLSPL